LLISIMASGIMHFGVISPKPTSGQSALYNWLGILIKFYDLPLRFDDEFLHYGSNSGLMKGSNNTFKVAAIIIPYFQF